MLKILQSAESAGWNRRKSAVPAGSHDVHLRSTRPEAFAASEKSLATPLFSLMNLLRAATGNGVQACRFPFVSPVSDRFSGLVIVGSLRRSRKRPSHNPLFSIPLSARHCSG